MSMPPEPAVTLQKTSVTFENNYKEAMKMLNINNRSTNKSNNSKSNEIFITEKDTLITYPYLEDKNDYGSYSVRIVIPKEKAEPIKNAIIKAAKYGKQIYPCFGSNPENPLKDGDKSDKEELKGCYYLLAKSKLRPQVFKPDKTAFDETVQSGARGSVAIAFYPYYHDDHGTTRFGVYARLEALMIFDNNGSNQNNVSPDIFDSFS